MLNVNPKQSRVAQLVIYDFAGLVFQVQGRSLEGVNPDGASLPAGIPDQRAPLQQRRLCEGFQLSGWKQNEPGRKMCCLVDLKTCARDEVVRLS
jgi:hypothetical protein